MICNVFLLKFLMMEIFKEKLVDFFLIWNEMKEEEEKFILKVFKWRRKDWCIIYVKNI